jgi:hypothetical protein
MWTRGRLRRQHTAAPVPHVMYDGRKGALRGAGAVPLNLPRPVIAMDPSDPRTWTRPVRRTT